MDYRHRGKLGDIVLALPVMKYYGGGKLYLETKDQEAQAYSPNPLIALLKEQWYITDVEVVDHGPSGVFNLNAMFTSPRLFTQHPALSACETCGVPREVLDEPWIFVEPKRIAPVVVCRSDHHHNPRFQWDTAKHPHSVFVGTEAEHKTFEEQIHLIEFYPANNLFEVAQVIAGAELFVGNQSCPLTIAEALGIPTIVEVFVEGWYAVPFRSAAQIHAHEASRDCQRV